MRDLPLFIEKLPIAAVNPAVWLWEHIQHVKQELFLFVDKVTIENPTSEGQTWLDQLQHLLQRGVKVHLCLNQLPDQKSGSGEAILIATHLRLLLRKGLKLHKTNQQLLWVAVIDPDTTTPSAIKAVEGMSIVLGYEVASQLAVTYNADAVLESRQMMIQHTFRLVEDAELCEPADTLVHEIEPDGKKHSEAEYFSKFYAKKPVRSMVISDRYLDTKEKILNRLGAHIDLAYQEGFLEWIVVKTQQWHEEQKQAIQQLKSRFPDVKIKFEFDRHTAHDRYIEVTRVDGHKARVIIGIGLDFIEPSGHVRNTFLVFQNSYLKQ